MTHGVAGWSVLFFDLCWCHLWLYKEKIKLINGRQPGIMTLKTGQKGWYRDGNPHKMMLPEWKKVEAGAEAAGIERKEWVREIYANLWFGRLYRHWNEDSREFEIRRPKFCSLLIVWSLGTFRTSLSLSLIICKMELEIINSQGGLFWGLSGTECIQKPFVNDKAYTAINSYS